MSDAWYPLADDYYIRAPDPDSFPVRQGDLLIAPEGVGEPWHACQLVHPTCEVGKASVTEMHVVRVRSLSTVGPNDQEAIIRGVEYRDGSPRVAWANTFFLPPIGVLGEPMFADFRAVARVPKTQLGVERRIGALTHDTRVAFIRRKLYWEQRWMLHLDDVRRLEATRIRADPAFVGEKPAWARSA